MSISLSSCVLGHGRCQWLEPFKTTLTGTLHFRSYPAADGMDHVPILALDTTTYIYAPALSHECLSANELQLVGVAEFPPNMAENSQIIVKGSLFGAVSGHQHTRFLLNVANVQRLAPPH